MKIEQLIKAVNESVNTEAFNTAVNPNSPLGRAQAAEKAKADAAAQDNTVQFPKTTAAPATTNFAGGQTQGSVAPKVNYSFNASPTTQPTTTTTAPATTPAATTTPATTTASPTGDATLDQPLAPKKPGTTLAQKVGGLAKGVGAVAGGVAGIGRAVKKGYAAGANAVGGPGAPAAGTTGGASSDASQAAAAAAGNAELDQLKATIQTMDQRLRRAGI